MILLDTSVLVDSLTGVRRSAPALLRAIDRGERIILPALVLYEWLRGPRLDEELLDHQNLFPNESTTPFGPEEAVIAAGLYKHIRQPRGRELDVAIAACAIAQNAILWTLNVRDFEDMPGLQVSKPE
jgi:predicted nucleic acid-binding protein